MGEWLDKHKKEIFPKYSKSELISSVNSFIKNSGGCQRILTHFFKEEIFKCRRNNRGSMTPLEFLNDDSKVYEILEYCKGKPNFYDEPTESQILDKWLSNSTKYTRRVSNFPVKQARDIYLYFYPEYNDIFYDGDKLNVLDCSSGFGSRMCASVLSNCNYYSTDPNETLHQKLIECAEFFMKNKCVSDDTIIDLRCCGSEIFIPEWENKMDVQFTSPPYFNLEVYGEDDSNSSKNYNNYSLWLNLYVKPTIDNIYKYLKVGGITMINIKNLVCCGKEPLFDDWVKLFNEHGGFERLNDLEMKTMTPLSFGKVYNYQGDSEPIMCFRKK